MKQILSVQMEEEEAKEDLWSRGEDLEEGKETEAVTAAAMAVELSDH